MRASTAVFFGFMGLILLAATMILVPKPGQETKTENSGGPSSAAPDVQQIAPPNPSQPTRTRPETATTEQAGELTAAKKAALRFPDWPKPQLVLVATGEQHGYFEPCGCTANQLGGMSRRADLFTKIEALGWTVRGVDVGGLSRRTGPQAQLKFETTLAAMREMKYVGFGLGPEELRLEPGYLLSQHLTDGDSPLSFLGANLVFFGSKELGTPLPLTIFEAEGRKVGVTSVMSDTIRLEVIPDRTAEAAENADLQWTDPTEALMEVSRQFDEAGVTFRVLLSQSTLNESRKLAEQFPAFDVIISANGFGDGERQPELIGSVRLLQVGQKGKMAGVIGIYPADSDSPVRFELVALSGEQFSNAPHITDLMRTYQERLRESQIMIADGAASYPSGATFVGSAKCGECHTQALEIWEQTAHAHALETLDPANHRPGFERLHGVARTFDPECIACHVTGWEPSESVRFRSGFINEEFAADDSEKGLQVLLAGSGCENCHGPGSRHLELIDAGNTQAAANEVRVTLEQAKGQSGCVKCHDIDNSPDFNFETYWDEIKHYGTN